jgi:hypothetical protein
MNRALLFRVSVWVLLLGFSPFSIAQSTVRGVVLDAKNRKPLPGATIFLANTTKGTTANADGSFTLSNVQPGKYQLVASFLGFATNVVVIDSRAKNSYTLLMAEQLQQLDGVVVKARRSRSLEWQENLRFFVDNFIGQSQNASRCRLINPQVLSFDKNDERFIARADEALLLENRGLGYKLRIQLEDFTYTFAARNVRYKSYVGFDTLAPINVEEKLFWDQNRRKAYAGSIHHFMRSIYERNLSEQGFFLRKLITRQNRLGEEVLVALPPDSTLVLPKMLNRRNVSMPTVSYSKVVDSLTSTPTKPMLAFGGLIEVTFGGEESPARYLKKQYPNWNFRLGEPQISRMEITQSPITVQADGQFFPPDGIRFRDYWAWELIAEELPVDFLMK